MTYTKVNTLWSLESVSDCYVFCHEDQKIYNSNTGKSLKISRDFQGYPIVYLCQKISSLSSKSVFYHKIIALALIHNGPYELIEHLDDNPLNNDVSNLRFSNKKENGIHAFQNGKHVHLSSEFEFCTEDDVVYRGTIKEISRESGIPEATLYDRIYANRPCTSKRTKYRFKYIKEIKYGTTRGYNVLHGKLNSSGLT